MFTVSFHSYLKDPSHYSLNMGPKSIIPHRQRQRQPTFETNLGYVVRTHLKSHIFKKGFCITTPPTVSTSCVLATVTRFPIARINLP